MRVGLITPGFSASEDDWCVPALTNLARVLAEHDELTVFALRYPHRRSAYSVHGSKVHPSGGAQNAGLARLPILIRTLMRVLREARRRPFDVLWAWWAHEPGFVAALAGRLTKTPVVTSILGGELVDLADIDYGGGRSTVNRWLIERALGGADRVTVGSKYLMPLAAERVPRDRLSLQPLGIDLERFSPAPSSEIPRLDSGPRLLQVASLIPVKDQITLLDAFEIVRRRHKTARLDLVGEGEAGLELAGRSKKLQPHLTLRGPIQHEALPDVYRRADLLIQSSHFESQGMAVLEAVACGCPAIGTEVGILPELCPVETTPTLTKPGDAKALAAIILSLLDNPDKRRQLAEAQAAALKNFELRESVIRWRQVLAANTRTQRLHF